jgi:antitoxin component of RelBE/YafQ-DinJ toxin-antitoxin module
MKEKLTLSVDRAAKQRAKRISEHTGISMSRLFEIAVNNMDDPEDDWQPTEGSAVAELMKIIPEHEKVDDYDYKKLKLEALEYKLKKKGVL